jgi:hypothetical protein
MADELKHHMELPWIHVPSLSWEEVEAGKAGQLPLPLADLLPTLGERTFLTLARRWHDEMQREQNDLLGSRSTER